MKNLDIENKSFEFELPELTEEELNSRIKGSFENAWDDAFKDAVAEPSPLVWDRIDLELANQEVASYKRQIYYYKMLAAASIFIASLLYVFQVNEKQEYAYEFTFKQLDGNPNPFLAEENNERNSEIEKSDKVITSNQVSASGHSKIKVYRSQKSKGNRQIFNSENPAVGDGSGKGPIELKPAESAPGFGMMMVAGDHSTIADNDLILGYVENKQSVLDPLIPEAPIVEPDLSDITIYNLLATNNTPVKKNEPKFWAGLALGSGVFDPATNSTSRDIGTGFNANNEVSISPRNNLGIQRPGSLQREATNQEDEIEELSIDDNSERTNPGRSFTLGTNFGTNISKRFFVQSGVFFGVYQSTTTTNLKVTDEETGKSYLISQESKFSDEFKDVLSDENQESFDYRETYEIENNLFMASLPLEVGYLLVKAKKWNLGIKTGTSLDFFLKNNIKSREEDIQNTSVRAGDNSPYNSTHINGIAGLNFDYKLSQYAYFQISPFVRKSLTPLSRNDITFNSNPINYGLSAGLKYNF